MAMRSDDAAFVWMLGILVAAFVMCFGFVSSCYEATEVEEIRARVACGEDEDQ